MWGCFPTGDEDRLLALAELSVLHVKKTEDRFYYMASESMLLRFSFQDLTVLRRKASILGCDLYNRAVRLVNSTPLTSCLSKTCECRCAVNFDCQRARFEAPMFLDTPWHNPCEMPR
jgi:hypothetical protein